MYRYPRKTDTYTVTIDGVEFIGVEHVTEFLMAMVRKGIAKTDSHIEWKCNDN